MELPARLRQAVDAALAGVPLADLQRASERLTSRYRAELRDGRLHLDDRAAALAYVTARLPATFAAVRASMAHAAERLPDFAPATQLDIGSGPGTALWAAADCWPSLARATLLDASPAIRALGEGFSRQSSVGEVSWKAFDIARDALPAGQADLVTLAYVLDELSPADQSRIVASAWERTAGLLLVIEPGTPAGWQRILAMRSLLLDAGAQIVAPCAHPAPCSLSPPDWCHFARRVARSQMHRLTKRGAVPWEDEKFLYLAASRGQATEKAEARVLAPPRESSGKVMLKLCQADGSVAERLVTRREGEVYKRARRAEWGDAL